MTYLNLNRDELNQEITAACERFVALLKSLKPHDAALPVPGLEWNVGELAAHVLTVMRRGLGDRRRSATPQETAGLNALVLEETPERDIHRLADLIATDTHTMLTQAFPRIDDDRRFPFHAGVTTTIITSLAIILGEFSVHGGDIAAATGNPWSIAPHTAALIWLGESDVMHGWLKKEAAQLNETYVIHFEGEPEPVALRLENGNVSVSYDLPAHVTHTLHVNPAEFIYYLPYQRRSAHDPVIKHLMSLFETL
jgi:uncharacterized protein (TIGR03083 family)